MNWLHHHHRNPVQCKLHCWRRKKDIKIEGKHEVSMRNGCVPICDNLGNLKIFLTDNMCVKLVNEIVVYVYMMTKLVHLMSKNKGVYWFKYNTDSTK